MYRFPLYQWNPWSGTGCETSPGKKCSLSSSLRKCVRAYYRSQAACLWKCFHPDSTSSLCRRSARQEALYLGGLLCFALSCSLSPCFGEGKIAGWHWEHFSAGGLGMEKSETKHEGFCFQPFYALLVGLFVKTACGNISHLCLRLHSSWPWQWSHLSLTAFVFRLTAVQTCVLNVQKAWVIFMTGIETEFSQILIPCEQSTAKLIQKALFDFGMFVS